MSVNFQGSGAWEKIRYPITPTQVQRKNDDDIETFWTECDECHVELWKNPSESITMCPQCGLVYSREAYDSVNGFELAYGMKTETEGCSTPIYPTLLRPKVRSMDLQKEDRRKCYNHSEKPRMNGGFRRAYTEENGSQYAIDNLDGDDQLLISTLRTPKQKQK